MVATVFSFTALNFPLTCLYLNLFPFVSFSPNFHRKPGKCPVQNLGWISRSLSGPGFKLVIDRHQCIVVPKNGNFSLTVNPSDQTRTLKTSDSSRKEVARPVAEIVIPSVFAFCFPVFFAALWPGRSSFLYFIRYRLVALKCLFFGRMVFLP